MSVTFWLVILQNKGTSPSITVEGNAASNPISLFYNSTGAGPFAFQVGRSSSLLLLQAFSLCEIPGNICNHNHFFQPHSSFQNSSLGSQQSFIIFFGNTFSLRITALAMRQGRTYNCVPGKPCLRPLFNASPSTV